MNRPTCKIKKDLLNQKQSPGLLFKSSKSNTTHSFKRKTGELDLDLVYDPDKLDETNLMSSLNNNYKINKELQSTRNIDNCGQVSRKLKFKQHSINATYSQQKIKRPTRNSHSTLHSQINNSYNVYSNSQYVNRCVTQQKPVSNRVNILKKVTSMDPSLSILKSPKFPQSTTNQQIVNKQKTKTIPFDFLETIIKSEQRKSPGNNSSNGLFQNSKTVKEINSKSVIKQSGPPSQINYNINKFNEVVNLRKHQIQKQNIIHNMNSIRSNNIDYNDNVINFENKPRMKLVKRISRARSKLSEKQWTKSMHGSLVRKTESMKEMSLTDGHGRLMKIPNCQLFTDIYQVPVQQNQRKIIYVRTNPSSVILL